MLVVLGVATAPGRPSWLALRVTGGNEYARLLFGRKPTVTTTVNTQTSTHVTVRGRSSALTSIRKGDRVLVDYQICKGDIQGSTAAAVAASLSRKAPRRVVDLGPPPAG
jgi:hypothetical protein